MAVKPFREKRIGVFINKSIEELEKIRKDKLKELIDKRKAEVDTKKKNQIIEDILDIEDWIYEEETLEYVLERIKKQTREDSGLSVYCVGPAILGDAKNLISTRNTGSYI